VDFGVSLGGLLVGLTVGLTGMGGGALMTPMLVLLFGVNPLTAVSTDIVASLVMKPIGGGVHARRGTVHGGIVRWLALGSVPAAFAGVLVLRALGEGDQLADRIETLLGVTLMVAATAMTVRVVLQAHRGTTTLDVAHVPVRPLPTVLVGLVGGLVVGMTSVGSGSLMIVLLIGLYPALESRALVGTDLVQAIPLVAAAALGHVLFGDLELGLTGALLVGCVPGVYLGARFSSRAPDTVIRPLLVTVLGASALKLLGLPNLAVALVGLAMGLVVVLVQRLTARRHAGARSSEVPTPAVAPDALG
jgi:uncharacterized membrane protein YfcA